MKKILLFLMALLASTAVWAENFITDVMDVTAVINIILGV